MPLAARDSRQHARASCPRRHAHAPQDSHNRHHEMCDRTKQIDHSHDEGTDPAKPMPAVEPRVQPGGFPTGVGAAAGDLNDLAGVPDLEDELIPRSCRHPASSRAPGWERRIRSRPGDLQDKGTGATGRPTDQLQRHRRHQGDQQRCLRNTRRGRLADASKFRGRVPSATTPPHHDSPGSTVNRPDQLCRRMTVIGQSGPSARQEIQRRSVANLREQVGRVRTSISGGIDLYPAPDAPSRCTLTARSQ